MNDLTPFFDHLDEFAHKKLFDGIETLWQPLQSLTTAIATILADLPSTVHRVQALYGCTFTARGALSRFPEAACYVERWIEISQPTYIEPLGIVLGAGTVLEPSAIIKGPAVIGSQCEIRQGAYVRGNVVTGDRCVIGHATEVKNSILMNHSEAGHFNYIGDSILGSYVNLGAGAKLANLEFRSADHKIKEAFPPIPLEMANGELVTGPEKFGAVLGDYVEIGCNAVLCPGVFLGKDSRVFANQTVSKGVYPPQTLLFPSGRKSR